MSDSVHTRFLEVAADLSPELERALSQVGPVTIEPRDSLPFAEVLCRAVAGQQLSVAAAGTIWSRVTDQAGDTPLCAHFQSVDSEALRQCGLSAAKARTMAEIAAAEASGLLCPKTLSSLDHAARAERITAIWGVGQWTADMMNIFYFGEQDIWPEGDVSARGWLQRLTSKRRKTVRTAERFSPHRSYLAIYMWRYADADLFS